MNVSVLLDLRDPIANRFERSAVRHVVHEQDALSSAEVRGGDGAETLLPRGIPDLQLDSFAIDLHILDLEVNTDGGNESGGEGVISVTKQQARFAHTGISDHEQLALHIIGGSLAHCLDIIIFIIRLESY